MDAVPTDRSAKGNYMSRHYRANQYEIAYKPPALRNWEVPIFFCSIPKVRRATTKIISNGNGQLLPGVKRPKNVSLSDFVGTWHLPRRIDRKTANILNGLQNKFNIEHCQRTRTDEDDGGMEKIGVESDTSEKLSEDETKIGEIRADKEKCPIHNNTVWKLKDDHTENLKGGFVNRILRNCLA